MLSRKERERINHRKDIINAAVHLFAKKGFNDTKLEDVATLAEFGKGTIYNHFENKNDLLISSINFVIDDVQSYLQNQIIGIDDVIKRIELLISSQFVYYQENEDYMHLMITQQKTIINEVMNDGNSELIKNFRHFGSMLNKEFQIAIETGRVKAGCANAYTIYLTGMMHGQFRALSMGEIDKSEINPQEILDIFFNGALNV